MSELSDSDLFPFTTLTQEEKRVLIEVGERYFREVRLIYSSPGGVPIHFVPGPFNNQDDLETLTAKAAELVEEEEDMANLMIHFRHQAHLMTRPPTSVLKNVWMFYFMNSHSEMLPVFRALKLRRMQAQYNVCLKKSLKRRVTSKGQNMKKGMDEAGGSNDDHEDEAPVEG